jgi:hypothetical protein
MFSATVRSSSAASTWLSWREDMASQTIKTGSHCIRACPAFFHACLSQQLVKPSIIWPVLVVGFQYFASLFLLNLGKGMPGGFTPLISVVG